MLIGRLLALSVTSPSFILLGDIAEFKSMEFLCKTSMWSLIIFGGIVSLGNALELLSDIISLEIFSRDVYSKENLSRKPLISLILTIL